MNNTTKGAAKHTPATPGPWVVSRVMEDESALINDSTGRTILLVENFTPAERDANAALIAAAPELADALEQIVRGDFPHGGTYSGSQCVEIARAALAKAGR